MAFEVIAVICSERRTEMRIKGGEGLTAPTRRIGILVRDEENQTQFFAPIKWVPEGYNLAGIPVLTPTEMRRRTEEEGVREVSIEVEKARRGEAYRTVAWKAEPDANESLSLSYVVGKMSIKELADGRKRAVSGVSLVKIKRRR